ncbi:hypothetical protein [Sinomonas gamaensis]|uniref:hypothetical protein n=1 Tax=Sinomonas gamaensis TaxID=2565624 RepID=UPI0011089846|nr:hypothetical protein [Sinomonas gamaensis]
MNYERDRAATAAKEAIDGPVTSLDELTAGLGASLPAAAEHELPAWTEDSYDGTITGSGAYKLADSGVAPLIAAARGYERIGEKNFNTLKDLGVRTTTKQGQRMKRTMGVPGRDGMLMPWYSINDVAASQSKNTRLVPFTHQLRPGVPEDNEQGKPIKYEFVSGIGTPLDLHPAIPAEWIDGAGTIMVAEGLLKGDSALSAYLKANGATWEDLAYSGPAEVARDRMRALLEAIPEKDRVFIFNIGGIHNDRQNPIDWRSILLKGRRAVVAYDADFKKNAHVWKAARGMEKFLLGKGVSEVRFLDPDFVEDEKPGVDDYLAKVGGWKKLMATATKDIGSEPASFEPGEVQVAADEVSVEEYAQGPEGQGYWKQVVKLGGRIKLIESCRTPTVDEQRTLDFGAGVPEHSGLEAAVEVEVAWLDDYGQPYKAVVRGPHTLLMQRPEEWARHAKASFPTSLSRNPLWPPRGASGDKWLAAVKRNRAAETKAQTRWMRMGWVPVEGGSPVFIAGDQVIGGAEQFDATAKPGVTAAVMDVARSFGVGHDIPDADWADQGYRDMVAEDIRQVVHHYVDSGAWTDPATGVLAMCLGLRPALPIRPCSTAYIWGPKGKGKSFTASRIMQFWAAKPGDDWKDTLPGQASDTAAYMEKAVSMAPIWVADDLAPSTWQRAADAGASKLEDLIRAVFNNGAKGRMNADMTTREANRPIAQLVITAENRLATASAMERTIPISMGEGALASTTEPTDELVQLGYDGIPARLTSHMIQWVQYQGKVHQRRWAGYHESVLKEFADGVREDVKDLMQERGADKSKLERISTLVGDVLLVLPVLQEMAHAAGVDRALVQRLSTVGMGIPVIQNAMQTHDENREAAPGASLMKALRQLLASGKAHIGSTDNPKGAPYIGTKGEQVHQSLTNSLLGWVPSSNGEMGPGGECIGRLLTIQNKDVVLFNKEVAFNNARRAFPDLIPPGQGSTTAWMAVWQEGFASSHLNPELSRSGKSTGLYRARIGGNQLRGVPVNLSTLVGWGQDAETQDEMADSLAA